MARIRTIKPEFWTNEKVMDCQPLARLLFIGLWNFADDLGRLVNSTKSIKAQIFPSDDINSENIRRMIDELSSNGLVLLYEVEGREYLQIVGWQHQRIDKPQPGRCPGPINGYKSMVVDRIDEHSSNDRRTFATEGKGEEGKGRESNSEADASGAVAPDPRSRLFGEGLAKVAAMTGKGPDSCRSFVGKCLKAADDDAGVVLGLIEDAERNRVVNPAAWIAARLKSTGPPNLGKPNAFRQSREETKAILDDLEHFARGGSEGRQANLGLLPGNSGERSEGFRSGIGADVIDLSAGSRRESG